MLRLYIPVLLLLLYIEASFFDPQSKIFDPCNWGINMTLVNKDLYCATAAA